MQQMNPVSNQLTKGAENNPERLLIHCFKGARINMQISYIVPLTCSAPPSLKYFLWGRAVKGGSLGKQNNTLQVALHYLLMKMSIFTSSNRLNSSTTVFLKGWL